jgi:hypothetical protein
MDINWKVQWMAEEKKAIDRPLGIKLITIFLFVMGCFLIVLASSAFVLDSDILEWVAPAVSNVERMAQFEIALLYGIGFITFGYEFWRLRGTTKIVISIVSGFIIVLYPLRLALILSSVADNKWIFETSDTVGIIVTAVGIPLSILIVWYLMKQEVNLLFEAQELKRTGQKIRTIEEKIEFGRIRSHSGEITKAEFAELKKECAEKERRLRARIKHLKKVRLNRERKIKDKEKAKKEGKEEKLARKEEKKAIKDEKKAEKEAKKEEEKGEEEEKEKPEKKEVKKKSGKEEGEE